MKQILKTFLALYSKNCTSIIFTFADGTNETINGKGACSEIIKAAKDNLAARLTRIVEPKEKKATKAA